MQQCDTALHIGLVIIGDELLSGKRQDRHLAAMIELTARRGLEVEWARLVGDSFDGLVATFQETRAWCARVRVAGGEPLVCSFGGIGATPDDRTRQALAQAAGVPLVPQPDAVARIERRFGADAYPTRIRMADLPQGAAIVENPVNAIPGLMFEDHCCVPGFPDMAHPMLAAVLDARLAGRQPEAAVEHRLELFDVAESRLVETLERLCAEHPELRISSLPSHRGGRSRVELGVRGAPDMAARGFERLQSLLAAAGHRFARLDPPALQPDEMAPAFGTRSPPHSAADADRRP